MPAAAHESPQCPSRGKRSVSFSCPTPLRSRPVTPLSRCTTTTSASTIYSPLHSPRSRSLSWNDSTGLSTPGSVGGKLVAWEGGEDGESEGGRPMRWNKQLEERLVLVERELKKHQKKWSAGQEDFCHELEHLLELKRAFKHFLRRRSKDHKTEGRRLWEGSSLVASDTEAIESEQDIPRPSLGATLKRRMSAPPISITKSSDSSSSEQVSSIENCQQPSLSTTRRPSLIQRVLFSRDANADDEDPPAPQHLRAMSWTTTSGTCAVESMGASSGPPSSHPRRQMTNERARRRVRIGGLLRKVTFPKSNEGQSRECTTS